MLVTPGSERVIKRGGHMVGFFCIKVMCIKTLVFRPS